MFTNIRGMPNEGKICNYYRNKSLLLGKTISMGKRVKCLKKPDNVFDSEVIKIINSINVICRFVDDLKEKSEKIVVDVTVGARHIEDSASKEELDKRD